MDPMVPPNTTAFLIAGYGVLLGGLFLYILSLAWRYRQVKEDLALLEELERRKS